MHWRFRGLDFVLHVFLHIIFKDEEKVFFYLVESCSFLMLYFYNDAHRPQGVTVATVARQQSIDFFFSYIWKQHLLHAVLLFSFLQKNDK